MNNNELRINPVESYNAPKIPTFSDDNSAMLKKLPSRWQKNAKVLALVGLAGAMTLTNFAAAPFAQAQPEQNTAESGIVASYSGYSDSDLVFRLTHGGAGFAFYVVHFTEQEALNIIKAQLEAAGLNFGATVPEYTFDWGGFGGSNFPTIGIDLFDEERNVAITHINLDMQDLLWRWNISVAENLSAQNQDITFGVFRTPNWTSRFHVRGQPPTDEQIAEEKMTARPILKANLTSQVQRFINLLLAEGILQHIEITAFDGENVTISSSLEVSSAAIMIVGRNADGKQSKIKSAQIALTTGENIIPLSFSQTENIQIFVWESIGSMIPIAEIFTQ